MEDAWRKRKPPPWKKRTRGRVFFEWRALWGMKIRAHVCLKGLMMMSLERTWMGREGSGEGGLRGLGLRRVREPLGLWMMLR